MAQGALNAGTGSVPTVGLEIHARLATATKLFCRCANRYGAEPNTQVCPVCLGLPGTLPVLDAAAVNLALRAGLALGCEISARSTFARKNYFYPDLPRNYQITQYEHPLCRHGRLAWADDNVVELERIHLEEDAGRLLAGEAAEARVDLNRAGTPLIEIVTRPDLCDGSTAAMFVQRLRQLLLFLAVCDGNLAEGSLRCDANIGFGPRPGCTDAAACDVTGPWTEVKNLNSIRAIRRAVDFEIERLSGRVAAGQSLRRETRSWDDETGRTEFMRLKETAADYRYFPEPDLPALIVTPQQTAAQRDTQPELPLAREQRYRTQLGLTSEQAQTLCRRPETATYFERTRQTLQRLAKATEAESRSLARLACTWICTEVLGRVETAGGGFDPPVDPEGLAELLDLVHRQRISGSAAKQVYERLVRDPAGAGAKTLVRELDLARIDDTEAIARWCAEVISRHPQQVAALAAGKQGVLDFLIGKVMQASAGKADPKLVRGELSRRLEARD